MPVVNRIVFAAAVVCLALPSAAAEVASPLGGPVRKVISQPFGVKWSAGQQKIHAGVDLRAKRGSPVYASAGGTVAAVDWFGCADREITVSERCPLRKNGGSYVIVQHADGTAAGYVHVNPVVKVGDRVSPGDRLGGVYYDHLHYNQCKTVDGCQLSAVSIEEFSKGNYLRPVFSAR
jgi:murein DD-endopeptidase MepM/ murein hydrolase activator NlpD